MCDVGVVMIGSFEVVFIINKYVVMCIVDSG